MCVEKRLDYMLKIHWLFWMRRVAMGMILSSHINCVFYILQEVVVDSWERSLHIRPHLLYGNKVVIQIHIGDRL